MFVPNVFNNTGANIKGYNITDYYGLQIKASSKQIQSLPLGLS